jgi:hypothetical protein
MLRTTPKHSRLSRVLLALTHRDDAPLPPYISCLVFSGYMIVFGRYEPKISKHSSDIPLGDRYVDREAVSIDAINQLANRSMVIDMSILRMIANFSHLDDDADLLACSVTSWKFSTKNELHGVSQCPITPETY